MQNLIHPSMAISQIVVVRLDFEITWTNRGIAVMRRTDGSKKGRPGALIFRLRQLPSVATS